MCQFYYGAILEAIFQYNDDASTTLISNDEEKRQVYRVLTNTSNKECIVFFKYSRHPKTTTKGTYYSWLFSFSINDKELINKYAEYYKLPIFIYLLCGQPDLKDSEIVLLKYDEYLEVKENVSITIGLEKGKNNFYLHRSKSDVLRIPRKRIGMKFNDLINSTTNRKYKLNKSQKLKDSKLIIEDNIYKGLNYYTNSNLCPLCNNDLIILNINSSKKRIQGRRCSKCNHIFLTQKHYKLVYDYNNQRKLRNDISIMEYGLANEITVSESIKENKVEKVNIQYTHVSAYILYVMKDDINKCPIHNSKMDVKVVSYGLKFKDTLYFCRQCNKYIISYAHSLELKKKSESMHELRKIIFRNI